MKFWTFLLAVLLAFGSMDADAARLGRGGSMGRQSPNVTQRYSAPQRAPTAPAGAQQSAPQPAPATPVPQRRPWGGLLGGLAAGLGLAWLAHTLGLGAGFGSLLLVALVVLLAMAAMGAMRRRQPQAGYAYGPGAGPDSAIEPRQYNPSKVGNDASARPWEQEPTSSFDPRTAPGTGGVRIGSHLGSGYGGLEGSQNWGVPAGFDTEGFLASAKRNFVTLQAAWDRSDATALRSMMTDDMLAQVRRQIAERPPGHQDHTEVVMLEAQLLGIEELATEYMASVEFSGLLREEPSAGPTPFREVWNMIKPKDGSAGWLVAGVQALQ